MKSLTNTTLGKLNLEFLYIAITVEKYGFFPNGIRII